MIGHDLGGRYEILTRIGGGGMALVYKAHDILLNRNVAVKVLRQQFVHDEEFIRRFRREAQSAASLSHPNVVSIYDVGQEDDTHYIVMEYIEGNNLNEIIQERAPLQTDEAVRIAVQICDALDHAHHNHIIHRDIKPHNILIGKNGRVKVTDFGIARAVTSSTITQTGSVVGSVHYFSPEHAKGVSMGEKSDLYSLGIVIYQMLTGKLPFLGESPISVALKHLQEEFEAPRLVNPHIPQSVENIILKATRKNQSERYDSAHEMLIDLDSCLKPERLNEPKATFVSDSDMDETRVMPAIRGDFRPVSPAVPPPPVERLERERSSSSQKNDVQWKEEGLAEQKQKGWKRPTTIVLVTLVALALLVWGFSAVLKKLDVPEVDVPYVVGMQESDARAAIEAKGLKVEDPVTREFMGDIPAGEVYEQTKANMRVKQGSFIHLSVSDGAVLEKLANYKGKMLQAAKDELSALGVNVDDSLVFEVEEVFSEEEPGTIISQSPDAGTEFDPKAVELKFMVSKGREKIEMPNLIGKTVAEAKDELKAHELVLNEDDILYEPSYVVKKGIVIESDPYEPKDPVSKGAKVSIRVSSGPPEDAREHQFNISISPAEAGKTSEVRIVYTDARGDNIEWGKRQIQEMQTFPVKVILSPDTEARVTVYRDGQFVDSKTITYEEIVQGAGSSTLSIPGTEIATPPPSPKEEAEPATTEPDQEGQTDGDGETTDVQQ
ncbi:Stk1 family PASTA domain-containing Ser/Thr kinase [Paenibacillus sp. NEAU-GSW1]|uniref:Stk1 family PASTA domain-containing Ser/Thr kinase n=1 Tax=Paenibacillus sp. NEAU-GSW1 TaxID=2682486 RepID=UPI0012E1A988|nr:Stk1 family PASTA domain-containing Ser/Thr kinase [Paenibacillus sp. NEAU-GSW1]MUT66830.1 Stk1 family PASTA domain-containing Ser/Thr kinase [Paenibacillus sp. NEAU-GSW1]